MEFLTGNTFLLIGIVSIVLLIISVLLEGIFDVFDFGDGPLSLTTLSAFGAAFGFAAFGAEGGGLAIPVAIAIGIAAGIVGLLLAIPGSRMLQNSESTSTIKNSQLKGTKALIILPIRDDKSLGEIAFSLNGHRYTFAAQSQEPLQVGDKVTIIDVLTESLVLVAPEGSVASDLHQIINDPQK
jgi:membrane protein implicated in regulation of membrane protease activity